MYTLVLDLGGKAWGTKVLERMGNEATRIANEDCDSQLQNGPAAAQGPSVTAEAPR